MAERERLNPPNIGEDPAPAPFSRPLDRILEGLRRSCQPDAYRLIPGEGDEADRWAARCPLHVDAGFTLLVTEDQAGGEPALWCRAGCPPAIIRYALVPDPERQREAERRAAVLLWAQSWPERRAG
jgi:hypothetical protein